MGSSIRFTAAYVLSLQAASRQCKSMLFFCLSLKTRLSKLFTDLADDGAFKERSQTIDEIMTLILRQKQSCFVNCCFRTVPGKTQQTQECETVRF